MLIVYFVSLVPDLINKKVRDGFLQARVSVYRPKVDTLAVLLGKRQVSISSCTRLKLHTSEATRWIITAQMMQNILQIAQRETHIQLWIYDDGWISSRFGDE
jgi:hypothetical protein